MSDLIQKIDGFLEVSSMAESTFGIKTVNDGKLVSRLRNGGRVWPETQDKIEQFIKSYPAPTGE
jgi:hypothetical protein